MPIIPYKFDTREFSHCGRNDLDCDDQINPLLLNDQATALNMGMRLNPRRIISNTISMGRTGDIKIDFELDANDPDYLVYTEFKMTNWPALGGALTAKFTGNLRLEFGIFSNPSLTQTVAHWFVNQADYTSSTGITPQIGQDVGTAFNALTISGVLNPALFTNQNVVHAFLRVRLTYPNVSPFTFQNPNIVNADPGFNHPETGEAFTKGGIFGMGIYTGKIQ